MDADLVEREPMPVSDPSGPDDASLLRGFAERGDRKALELLFQRHADTAFRFALRLSGNAADAEDAVQSAFLQVFRTAGTYQGESAVKSWILGFVMNACRNKAREEGRRKARQERAAGERETLVSAAPDEPESREHVRRAVQDLPEHYRAPLWLHYAEGLSSGEVADVLHLPEDTVRKQLSRGIDRLRVTLAPFGAALSLAAILPTLAVETAPSTLTASLAGMAAGASPVAAAVKAGAIAKFTALGVAAMTVLSTVTILWWGESRTDLRPPDFAEIDRQVREWQPSPEERRFDQIGWTRDLREALRLSKESGRPMLLLSQSGRVNLGRTDGGSQGLRAGGLADPRVIGLLNGHFVPVYVSNVDYGDGGSADPGEKSELRRIWQEAHDAGMPVGMDWLFLLDPATGRVTDTLELCKATREKFAAWLEGHRRTPPGDPLVGPAPQSLPPPAGPDDVVLHLTARYLDGQERVEQSRAVYHEFPAEDWIVLGPGEWKGLLSPGEVEPALARRLFAAFHPLDMSVGSLPDGRNRYQETVLRVTFVSRSFARIEGRLRMDRSFTQITPSEPHPVLANVRGYLEIDADRRRIRSIQMITAGATYGTHHFGVAVRSVR
jgi:RNA polymerase sigma factor (sigma-70 family)